MIPLRLELKNFMSYGEEVSVLDLAGMHTVCLSGENGNGKSALLDAITWSLWGESRAGKNKHDELIRKGADEMSVQFTFEIENHAYRVLRKRSKRAAGNQWELQQSMENAQWRPLTGNNSGETERAIQKLLRMSYDTFLNSAYLRQGHADQFVRQTPGKRKEILADILDLTRYDRLEAKAREKAREASAEATDLEREMHVIDAELLTENSFAEALVQLRIRLQALHDQQETLKAEWDSLRDRKGQVDSQKQFTDTLKSQRSAFQQDLAAIDLEIAAHQRELDGLKELLERQDDIHRNYEALIEARKQAAELEESLARWNQGRQMLAAAELEWQAAENEVRGQAAQAARDHDQAVNWLREHPNLNEEHHAVSRRVAEAEALIVEQKSVLKRREEVEAQFHALREESAVVDAELRQWQTRLDALGQQRGVCEVCNSPLPVDRVATVSVDYERHLAKAQEHRKGIRGRASTLKDEIAALRKRESKLDEQLAARRQDPMRLGQLEQQMRQLESIQKDFPNLLACRKDAEKVVASGAFAPELREKIKKFRSHLDSLRGIEEQYAQGKALLTALVNAERQYLELQQAQKTVAETGMRLARAKSAQAQRRESLKAIEDQVASLPDVDAELARLDERLRQIREQEGVRRQDEHQVTLEIGSREDALKRLAGLRATRIEKEKHLAAAKQDQEVHEQLVKAFGKNGVQALIIENAIPELQDEANRLLERLTDGDMSMHFDTHRAAKAKKGSEIETLDIVVSDSYGARQLEMYSGGEGFRAAFALRIALSKLLARRAGARLQTLIIDEGFGTQDGKGREKLVDALNAIGSDFEKIIVITHIDELKDAFAARVEIVKTSSGSQITVMEGAAG